MKYITTAVLALQAGVALGLSEAQAATRKLSLTPLPQRKGWYTTTGPIEFKVGEVFQCKESMPKGLADTVEDPEELQAKQAAKAKAEAAAKAAEEAAQAEALAAAQAKAKADADAAAAAAEAEAKAKQAAKA